MAAQVEVGTLRWCCWRGVEERRAEGGRSNERKTGHGDLDEIGSDRIGRGERVDARRGIRQPLKVDGRQDEARGLEWLVFEWTRRSLVGEERLVKRMKRMLQ
jgi:hypothetical protein